MWQSFFQVRCHCQPTQSGIENTDRAFRIDSWFHPLMINRKLDFRKISPVQTRTFDSDRKKVSRKRRPLDFDLSCFLENFNRSLIFRPVFQSGQGSLCISDAGGIRLHQAFRESSFRPASFPGVSPVFFGSLKSCSLDRHNLSRDKGEKTIRPENVLDGSLSVLSGWVRSL